MSKRDTPPFRADHVGSLLRPAELLAARENYKMGHLTAGELRDVENRAIEHAIRLQESAGLRGITDGEFRRTYFHVDFLEQFDGVHVAQPEQAIKFHRENGEVDFAPPVMTVKGRLHRPGPVSVQDFKFLRDATRRTPKLSIPSPSMLHFRGGRGGIDKRAYPDIDEFFDDLARLYREEINDLAEVGCRYIQLDDTNLAYLCDEAHRRRVRELGEDPALLPLVYARLISDSIMDRPADMKACVHLCRGNFASAWVAEGAYDPVAEVLFNEIDVDGFFLEYDDARSGGFEPLRFVPDDKIVVLGLVTTKRPDLEDRDLLKRRIEEASRYVDIERLCLSPQCGFSSTVHGNQLSESDEIAKLELIVDVAMEVWGGV